jgi:tRNA(fMet)-specific endonuclease VapC
MYLLDTDIVSFGFKGDSRARFYERYIRNEVVAISFMTLAELYKWPRERNFSAERRAKLEEYLKAMVLLPGSASVARMWAEMMVDLRSRGVTIGFPDSWIAATALRHDLPLVTHNRKLFEGVPGLRIISES